jgi:lipopolysaccharide transport system ATP-binding protein
MGLNVKPHTEKWVIRNISFAVKSGETLGIIGQNGAGKSTLLKLLCRTLQPTEGFIEVTGKIAALLELGMGFNPELTGRANVYISAGLLGYSYTQISAAIPEIAAFAEIGDYFEAPLRTYSSGMQMRLAFSVATAFRPEVLVIDEALSVGDSYFQHKSFARIKQFQKQGTTLLFVSHDRSAVLSLCERAILIDEHTLKKDGPPEEVFDLYNALIAQREGAIISQRRLTNDRIQTISGTGEAAIDSVALIGSSGFATETVSVGEAVTLTVNVRIVTDISELVVGYMIKDRIGQPIFGTNSHFLNQVLYDLRAGCEMVFRFRFQANLGVGHYSIAISLHQGDAHVTRNYEWRDLAYTFSVINSDHSKFIGTAWVPPILDIIQ